MCAVCHKQYNTETDQSYSDRIKQKYKQMWLYFRSDIAITSNSVLIVLLTEERKSPTMVTFLLPTIMMLTVTCILSTKAQFPRYGNNVL